MIVGKFTQAVFMYSVLTFAGGFAAIFVISCFKEMFIRTDIKMTNGVYVPQKYKTKLQAKGVHHAPNRAQFIKEYKREQRFNKQQNRLAKKYNSKQNKSKVQLSKSTTKANSVHTPISFNLKKNIMKVSNVRVPARFNTNKKNNHMRTKAAKANDLGSILIAIISAIMMICVSNVIFVILYTALRLFLKVVNYV